MVVMTVKADLAVGIDFAGHWPAASDAQFQIDGPALENLVRGAEVVRFAEVPHNGTIGTNYQISRIKFGRFNRLMHAFTAPVVSEKKLPMFNDDRLGIQVANNDGVAD